MKQASGLSDSSASESSESEDGSDSDEEESESDNGKDHKPVKEKEPALKKRKAEEAPASQVKKSKIEPTDEGQSSTLFVGGLSFNVDDEWLKSEFASFGCQSARVVWNRETDSSRGYVSDSHNF